MLRLMVLALVAAAWCAPAQAAVLSEFPVPAGVLDTYPPAFAEDGGMWFATARSAADFSEGKKRGRLLRTDPRTVAVPGRSALVETLTATSPVGRATALRGNRLIYQQGVSGSSRVSILDIGSGTERTVPYEQRFVGNFVQAPDGGVWAYASKLENSSLAARTRLIRIDPGTATVTDQIELPEYVVSTSGILLSQGALWFVAQRYRLTAPSEELPAHMLRFDLATRGFEVVAELAQKRTLGAAAGPDGRLFFSVGTPGSSIVGLDPGARTLRSYDLSESSRGRLGSVYDLAFGGDGGLWTAWNYAGTGSMGLRRLDVGSGDIQEVPLPTGRSEVVGVAPGPDGSIWFTRQNNGDIGRVSFGETAVETELSDVLRDGFNDQVECAASCEATVSLQAPPAAGGSRARAAARRPPRVLARTRVRRSGAGTRAVKLRLNRSAKRALRGRRTVRLTLQRRIRSGGRVRTTRVPVRLRHLRMKLVRANSR